MALALLYKNSTVHTDGILHGFITLHYITCEAQSELSRVRNCSALSTTYRFMSFIIFYKFKWIHLLLKSEVTSKSKSMHIVMVYMI